MITIERSRSSARRTPARSVARIALAASLSLLALLSLAATPLRVCADTLQEVFRHANEAYFRGDLAAAEAGYRRLAEAGIDDPVVSFDLATTYAREGQLGRAILWFERTLVREPADDGAERGIAAARAAIGRRHAEAHGEATVETQRPFTEALVAPISQGALAWIVLVLDLLFFGVLVARMFSRADVLRLGLGIAAPLLGIALALAAGGLAVKAHVFSDGDPGVVLGDAPLREGPDPRAAGRGEAVEGEPATVLGREAGFVHVRLGGARDGWLSAADVETI